MEEVEVNSVSPEVAPPETEAHAEQTQAAKVETPVDDTQERNWRQMRMRQNELERKLKEKEEMLEKFVHMQLNAQVASAPKEIDELDQISDEEFIPKGKVKKLVEKQAQKYAEEVAKRETEKFIQQQHQSQFLDRLKKQYSDFDEIVNPETLALLEQQNPDLAQTIVDLKDPYKIGLQSYNYIKAMNLHDKVPQVRRAKEVEKKLDQNAKTVQTPQAFDKRPMAQAYKMTDVENKKLYEEMIGYARQASFSY